MVDKTDDTMVKRIKGERGETNNGGQDSQHNGQENKGRGGGTNNGGQDRRHNGQENKGGEGGDKQWWTRQSTQWSRE